MRTRERTAFTWSRSHVLRSEAARLFLWLEAPIPSPDGYNDEQVLRFAVKLAYLTAVDKYAEVEELPSGHGYADIVCLPKAYSRIPALLVELKWNKPVDSAIEQIHDRNYPKVLAEYGGPLVLVAVTYDSATKEHRCKIERLRF